MRRLLFLVLLTALVLAVFATPAFAWHNPQRNTAYIQHPWLSPWGGWDEWAGTDAWSLIHHDGPIPTGWTVCIATTWWEYSKGGAGFAPGQDINTFSLTRDGGSPTKSVLGMAGVTLWSPVYPMTGSVPGAYARDWWVPIGVAGSEGLPSGHYSGWFRMYVPRTIPSWIGYDEEGNPYPLKTPELVPPIDTGMTELSFDVM